MKCLSEQNLKLFAGRLPLLRMSSNALQIPHLLGKFSYQLPAAGQLPQAEHHRGSLRAALPDSLQNALRQFSSKVKTASE